MREAEGRIPSLDGLRAASIALVLFGHASGTAGFPKAAWLSGFGDLANLGVNAFFIISGFLITSLLMGERASTGSVSLRGFYARRALRILPAAYVFILAIAIAGRLGWLQVGASDLAAALAYVVNFDAWRSWNIGHLWSLSVEEQFYLLWPLLFVRLAPRRALAAALAAFAAAPVVRTAVRVLAPDPYRGLEIFPAVADGIAIGAVIAMLRPWLLTQAGYLRLTRSRWLWCLLPLIVLVNRYRGYAWVDLLLWPWMLVAGAVLIEASARRRGTWAWRVLNWRPVVVLGVLSYSVYLWQQPFLNRQVAAVATTFPLNLALALAAVALSYLLVERPFLRLRRRFRSAGAEAASAAPEPAPIGAGSAFVLAAEEQAATEGNDRNRVP